jgi:hypothetical protein
MKKKLHITALLFALTVLEFYVWSGAQHSHIFTSPFVGGA